MNSTWHLLMKPLSIKHEHCNRARHTKDGQCQVCIHNLNTSNVRRTFAEDLHGGKVDLAGEVRVWLEVVPGHLVFAPLHHEAREHCVGAHLSPVRPVYTHTHTTCITTTYHVHAVAESTRCLCHCPCRHSIELVLLCVGTP